MCVGPWYGIMAARMSSYCPGLTVPPRPCMPMQLLPLRLPGSSTACNFHNKGINMCLQSHSKGADVGCGRKGNNNTRASMMPAAHVSRADKAAKAADSRAAKDREQGAKYFSSRATAAGFDRVRNRVCCAHPCHRTLDTCMLRPTEFGTPCRGACAAARQVNARAGLPRCAAALPLADGLCMCPWPPHSCALTSTSTGPAR